MQVLNYSTAAATMSKGIKLSEECCKKVFESAKWLVGGVKEAGTSLVTIIGLIVLFLLINILDAIIYPGDSCYYLSQEELKQQFDSKSRE